MSATNSTTHYSLPSFLGSDKPAWLVDWNGAMATIDSAIYEAKQAADTASSSASAVASDLATLSGTVSTQGSTISALSDTLTTAVGNINTINGNITTINSLIGNGTPTTTDQTIIGAINEINANVTDASTPGTLANTVAGLTGDDLASNVNIASYTTFSGAYTAPKNGYIRCYVPSDGNLNYRFYGASASADSDPHMSLAHKEGSYAEFIKKGFKVYVTGLTGACTIDFYGIE